MSISIAAWSISSNSIKTCLCEPLQMAISLATSVVTYKGTEVLTKGSSLCLSVLLFILKTKILKPQWTVRQCFWTTFTTRSSQMAVECLVVPRHTGRAARIQPRWRSIILFVLQRLLVPVSLEYLCIYT